MTGTRHHFLPRFLLKGFASRINNKKAFTWVYRKDGKVFEVSTKDIGVEEHFYGRDGELNVDSEITELEIKFTGLLTELRQSSSKEEIIDPRIAEFITHLCTRTKHLRDSLRESNKFLVESLEEYLSDFINFKGIILNNPQLIINAFEEESDNYKISRPQKDVMVKLLLSVFPNFIDQQKSELQLLGKVFFMLIQEALPKMLKEAHIETLKKELIPNPRVENYRSLKWFVCQTEVPLILGDVGCLFKNSENRYKALDSKDEIKNIFLPISSNQMLVGTQSNFVPQLDFQSFNQLYVKHSREYFICSKSSTEMALLALSIGEESRIISKAEIEQMVKEIMTNKIQ